jgi:hypothetical protein
MSGENPVKIALEIMVASLRRWTLPVFADGGGCPALFVLLVLPDAHRMRRVQF